MSQTTANAGYTLVGKRKSRKKRRKVSSKEKRDYKKEYSACETALSVLNGSLQEDSIDQFIKRYKDKGPEYTKELAAKKYGKTSSRYKWIVSRMKELEDISRKEFEQAKKEVARKQKEKKKAAADKERKRYLDLAKTGGLIITPEGIRIPIEPGEDPVQTIQKYSPQIAKKYDYAWRFLRKAKDAAEGGAIPEDDWALLQDVLLRRGWTVAYAGEIISRRFDEKTIDNIHKYIMELDWPDDLRVKLVRTGATKPSHEIRLEDLLGVESERDLSVGKLVAVPGKEKRVRKTVPTESAVDSAMNLLEVESPDLPGYDTDEEEEDDEPEADKWRRIKTHTISKRIPKVKTIRGRTFKQLLRGSESGRRGRARNVRTKPPLISADEDGNEVMIYNFKSYPSTTGKRQRGYARFFRPRGSRAKTLGNLPVEVSCTCLHPDMLVQMADGTQKFIKDINVGEHVISHTGKSRKVLNKSIHQTNKDLYALDIVGSIMPLVATSDHSLFAMRGNDFCLCRCGTKLKEGYTTEKRSEPHNRGNRWDLRFSQGHYARGVVLEDQARTLQWVETSDLWDYESLFCPWFNFDENVELDQDTAFVLGLFMAEGVFGKSSINFTIGLHEVELEAAIKRMQLRGNNGISSVSSYPKMSKRGTKWLKVSVFGEGFKEFVKEFCGGTNAHNKFFTDKAMRLTPTSKLSLLAGLIAGDGHINKHGRIGFSTVGFDLFSQSRSMTQSLGMRTVSCPYKPSESGYTGTGGFVWRFVPKDGDQRLVNILKKYHPSKRNLLTADFSRAWNNEDTTEDGVLYTLSKKILFSSGIRNTVCDIKVEEDESFIANGVVVHNCPDFKFRWEVANKKVGSSQIFHSNGKNPNKTNPTMRPGLCKHLIALGGYISGVKVESINQEPKKVSTLELLS